MDIPINTEVKCSDGTCGRSTYVVLNPTTEQVTHLVVKERHFPHTERLVPITQVIATTPDLIRLQCSGDELAKMQAFIETEFIRSEIPEYGSDPFLLWPYVVPEAVEVPVEHERIPPGELAVHRGAKVIATDGRAGQVDEFLVDPAYGHITHLVLREGHFWNKKEVAIPVSKIDRIEEDEVYLKLDKHGLEALPAVPFRRLYTPQEGSEVAPVEEEGGLEKGVKR